jgi:DNA-binding GntR family transcriptional regulator
MAELLERSNLRDQALSVLRERLVSGDMIPGEIYSASALAVELGVSTSPVREAMLTLVNQGLMEIVRNRGFRVTALSERERVEISELRMLLEVPVMVSLAGDPRVVDQQKQLSRQARDIVEAARKGDIPRYLEADRRFHLDLIALTGNQKLTDYIDHLRDRTRLFNLAALSEEGRLIGSAEEHQAILDALVAGDREGTERLMRHHLQHIEGDWAVPAE